MLEALVFGTRDPEVLSELARGKLRKNIRQLERALEGRFVAAHHGFNGRPNLVKLDFWPENTCGNGTHLDARDRGAGQGPARDEVPKLTW